MSSQLSADERDIKEQDRFLPIANVARIMKGTLPDNAKIAKESKECVQECVSEFISFITSEAAERCTQEKRKTINGDDILSAMQSLGFDNYSETLKIYLSKYREATKVERSTVTPTPEHLPPPHMQHPGYPPAPHGAYGHPAGPPHMEVDPSAYQPS